MGERAVGAPVAPAVGSPFERLLRRRAATFSLLLKRSGRVGSPASMAERSVKGSLVAASLALPVSILLSVLVFPWFMFGALAPLAPAMMPELRLRDSVAQRREGVERELPFFAMLASILGSAGVPLYSVLRDIAGGDVFEWVGKEAKMVKRDVEILGMNPNEAFERLASVHPSKRFAEFLLGYTSKARSGGDVPFYLVGESGSLLGDLQEGWGRYVARVGIIGSMMITVFGVVPLLLMVVGVFSPGVSVVGLVLFTGLGVPTFTIVLLQMAGRMQPMREEAVSGKAGLALLAALPGALMGLTAGPAWAGVAISLLAFFTVYGFSVRKELAEVRGVDQGVARFLQDLLEYKRQEYDLARAVVAIEANGRYNPHFSRVLSRVAGRLRAGVPLDEVKVECKGKLGKLTFLILGQMSRSGGGTVDTVYQMSTFAGKMTTMRQNASAEMKPYLALSYVSPLLLAFGVTFVEQVLSSFRGRGATGVPLLHLSGFSLGSLPPGLSQVSDLLIVVSAASLGLIGAKMTDLTVRNTLRASVNIALAVVAVLAMAAVGSHSLSRLL